MILKRISQPLEPEALESVESFLKGIELELRKYTLNQLVSGEARVLFAGLPEYPKLFVRLSWPQLDESIHHFEGSVTLRELGELSEDSAAARWDFTYHFARMLLSSLALSEVVRVRECDVANHRKGELFANGPCTDACLEW